MEGSRKRRRTSDASASECNGETIALVLPRRLRAVVIPRSRPRPRETSSQANVGKIKSSATQIQDPATVTTSRPTSPRRASLVVPYEEPPATCCYRCRHRGGRAQENCVYENGQQSCTRCINQNNGVCRMPTDKQLEQLNARCLRCKRRGFLICKGGIPCDTCVRNRTPHLCQGRPVETTKRRNLGPAEAELHKSAGPSSSHRLTRKKRRTEVETEDVEEDHPGPDLRTTKGQSNGPGSDNGDHAVTHEDMVISDDSSSEDNEVEYGSATSVQSTMERFVTPDEMVVGAEAEGPDTVTGLEDLALGNHLDRVTTSKQRTRRSNDSSSLKSSSNDSRQAVSTEATSVMEDDGDQGLPLRTRKHPSSPSAGVRPRRSGARKSYVDLLPDIFPDHGPDTDVDDESDVYQHSASSGASVIEEEFTVSDMDDSSTSGEQEPDDTTADIEVLAPHKKTQNSKSEKKGAQIWKNWDLPPLNNIEEIIGDMAAKATQMNIKSELKKLRGRPINVATMCSGTESPLIFLNMIAKALGEAGEPAFEVAHHFSVEIDAIKQAYIERNFAPPKLFRDARDFIPENATTATTAYGAIENVPKDIDMFIGGFVCKDLSSLNSYKKDIDENGQTGETWKAMLEYSRKNRPTIVLIENVRGEKKIWEYIVSEWAAAGYEATWHYRDTKDYYLPQTRLRMYMIAVNREMFGTHAAQAVANWKTSMVTLQRPCSTPFEAFLKGTATECSNIFALPPKSEPAWVQCKLKYDRIRSEQRLGIKRPVTRWSENGTLRPPDYADHEWYSVRSSREWECIDIAHLQRARSAAYDTRFKMEVWDVSQSFDYYGAPLGIVGCITPSGCDFVTNQQTVLTGSQMLRLQGMPNDKLLFARESQKDLQDLAGNAMSTTVIGASLISALLCGTKFFAKHTPMLLQTQCITFVPKSTLIVPNDVTTYTSTSENELEVDIVMLTYEAFISSRLCGCEQFSNISDTFVRVCAACSHTACARHAGNPIHAYTQTVARSARTQTPHAFLKKWKSIFPSRLRFATFPDLRVLVSKAATDNKHVVSFLERVREADIASQHLYINEIERQEGRWSFTYSSTEVTLKARVSETIQWLVYVKAPSSLPGNDPLRKVFEQPIARGLVSGSLLAPEWEFFVPFRATHTLQIQASIESTSSWRNRHGLPEYKTERIPIKLSISSKANGATPILGDYQLHSDCGTACDSLYKKADSSTFLFLDPGLVSDPKEDSFVFSDDLDRRIYGESRITFGSLDPSWRPWGVTSNSSWSVDLITSGNWVPYSPVLMSTPLSAEAVMPSESSLAEVFHDCTEALTVLDIQITEDFDPENITKLSWVPEDIKSLPDFKGWHQSTSTGHPNCSCAPSLPQLVWSVELVKGKPVATARENAKAAATFERALKLRCPIFTVQPSGRSRLRVGLNIASLTHRAQGRLPNSSIWSIAWRLCVDHTDVAPVPLPKYTLQCNSATAPFEGELGLRHSLYHSQLQSLTWMKAQEQGRSLTITEVEEATQKDLGWRAEARAQTVVMVRGGVLADRPSFGKTVTTIALLQSEFQQHSPEDLLNQDVHTSDTFPLEVLSATLIVCPPHLARQWRSEMEDFLGPTLFEQYHVLLIESFSDLQEKTMDDFKKARAIILSWSVLFDDKYISHLGHFAAMPKPATKSGSGFDAWMRKATAVLPERLDALRSEGLAGFKVSTAKLLKDRLSHPEFKETVPIKLQHGAQYESFDAIQNAAARSAAAKAKKIRGKPETKSTASEVNDVVPLLHLFRFNRIVVDEYHYLLNDKSGQNYPAHVGVKVISALKRWVLSGTPALSNFSDVNEIASFLGVKLGRNVFGDGATITPFEKKLRDEQTEVQKFLMRTEIMSQQWHEARHERAQEFLNLFVRKNKPSLEHIACREHLQPIELDLAHNAVYLELSQYVAAQGMQLKRPSGKSKANTDRVNRIDAILNDSASAEDALLKGALGLGGKGIESLIKTRSEERETTKSDMLSILVGFESLTAMDDEVKQLYRCFKDDVQDLCALGDGDSSHVVRLLLGKAARNAKHGPQQLSTVKGKKGSDRVKALKTEISKLRELARDLALKMRSLRFITAIKTVASAMSSPEGAGSSSCDSADCEGISSVHQFRLITECGHLVCEKCLTARDNHEACVLATCSARVTVTELIKATDLGTPNTKAANHSFGNKLVAMAQLILKTPKDDQCIVFVPNFETISTVEAVLQHFSISYYALSNKRTAASLVEEFKTCRDAEMRKKVLLLNLGSESAAGTNLTNANHILFASPLLTKSQYEFDSAMAQAIARCLRYGQKKTVHIHHFAALHTIDVNILEQRHKRRDGIAAPGDKIDFPRERLEKKGRTRMVRVQGKVALVPVQWVEQGVGDVEERFASLIGFEEGRVVDDD